jgi:hypothetical protein
MEETTEGSAYLMALKKSATSPASSSEQSAPEAKPAQVVFGGIVGSASAQTTPSADRRRSPRYRCEGSVELLADGCEARTFAAFTDISLHGCYVEAQATYPAGTALHLKLEANGFKVETRGTVRVNYPYLGMGIAFVEMSGQDQTQLSALLRSIAPPSVIMGPGIASTLPASGPLEALPPISNPQAAIRELAEFFENRQMLMREDFLRILRASQSPKSAR